ncbi:hypothetical protein PG5_61020 [Pseudomonas sp. G5(2012)]|nr:hypothetical protein PG5_61020 [Pseudomonas sp. G5(2012)]
MSRDRCFGGVDVNYALAGLTLSRASPLPHLILGIHKNL